MSYFRFKHRRWFLRLWKLSFTSKRQTLHLSHSVLVFKNKMKKNENKNKQKTDSFHNWVNRNSKLNNESKLLWNDSLITWETIFVRKRPESVICIESPMVTQKALIKSQDQRWIKSTSDTTSLKINCATGKLSVKHSIIKWQFVLVYTEAARTWSRVSSS